MKQNDAMAVNTSVDCDLFCGYVRHSREGFTMATRLRVDTRGGRRKQELALG
jgi:hypothetical protein